jgi:hypothetical protein
VQLFGLPDGLLDARLGTELGEPLGNLSIEGVAPEHDALVAMDTVRRIPQLSDVLRGPGNAAVDTLTLPESLFHLQAELEVLAALDSRAARSIVGGKVVLDAAQQIHGNTVQAKIRLHRHRLARSAIHHLHATFLETNRSDRRIGAHQLPDAFHERGDDAIHTAHGLHQHRGLILRLDEAEHAHQA